MKQILMFLVMLTSCHLYGADDQNKDNLASTQLKGPDQFRFYKDYYMNLPKGLFNIQITSYRDGLIRDLLVFLKAGADVVNEEKSTKTEQSTFNLQSNLNTHAENLESQHLGKSKIIKNKAYIALKEVGITKGGEGNVPVQEVITYKDASYYVFETVISAHNILHLSQVSGNDFFTGPRDLFKISQKQINLVFDGELADQIHKGMISKLTENSTEVKQDLEWDGFGIYFNSDKTIICQKRIKPGQNVQIPTRCVFKIQVN